MKIFLKIFFAAFALLFVLVITGIFLPKKMQFVAKKKIDASSFIVFEQLNDFNNWANWMPWFTKDTNLEFKFDDLYKGKNATINWTSQTKGEGKAIITHSVMPESVATELSFGANCKTICLWYIEPTQQGCELNWTLNLSRLGLYERFLLQLYKKQTQAMLCEGLEQIKINALKLKYSRTGEISEIETPSIPTIVMIDSVNSERVKERLEQMDTYLLRFFERRALKPTGQAFNLVYPAINDTLVKIGVGYPIEERTWVWRTLKYMEIPEGKVLTQIHYGKPENTGNSHREIENLINKNGFAINGTPWEVPLYKKDTLLKDTSIWQTQVFYPIK